jgi:LysR family nitrogen assimilation transcriptional regulator
LTQTAIRSDSNRDPPLSVIPISDPEIKSTLCLAQSAQKRGTALLKRTATALALLARGL